MYKCKAIALQLLHDESLAPKNSCSDFPVEGNADFCTQSSTQKRILLHDYLAAKFSQIHWYDCARIRCGKAYLVLPSPHIGKVGEKDALTAQGSHACIHQFAQDALAGLAAIAHLGAEVYSFSHIHHCTCFGNYSLLGVEGNLHHLDVFADYFEVDFVAFLHDRAKLQIIADLCTLNNNLCFF